MTNPTADRAEGAPRRTPEPWHGITGECYCDGTPHGKDACTTIEAEGWMAAEADMNLGRTAR